MDESQKIRTLSLGTSTKEVISMFTTMLEEHRSITHVFCKLLERRFKRTIKYCFQTLGQTSTSEWILEVPDTEDSLHLKKILNKLDEYVLANKFRDRASAIEDLMFGPLDDIPVSGKDKLMILIEGDCDDDQTYEVDDSNSDLNLNNTRVSGNSSAEKNQGTHSSSGKGVLCPICKECFSTKISLQKHCRHSHLRHLTFVKSGEIKVGSRELTKCAHCNYVALRKGRLATHLKTMHKITEEIYCKICEKSFPSHRTLHHHVMQFHTLINITCKTCDKVCKNRSSFQNHQLSHTRTFQCEYCDKLFNDRRSYLQHVKRHLMKVNFDCSHCGQTFNQKANMERHIRNVHLKEGKLLCESCTFTTFYPHVLKDHVNRVHFGIKIGNFSCKHCSKIFSRRSALDEHVDRHEGTYRYSCSTCGKKYRSKVRCQTHFTKCKSSNDNLDSQSKSD